MLQKETATFFPGFRDYQLCNTLKLYNPQELILQRYIYALDK